APKYLRSENLLSHLFNRHTPHDLGDLIVPHRRDIQEAEMVDRMKYIHSILAVNKELSNTVYNVLHTTNYLPIIIGGDHALSWGSIAGVKREYADISVFY
ncbi:MAG: arginase family protein, partial [Alistipes sp.]